jgi:hypothetical protein
MFLKELIVQGNKHITCLVSSGDVSDAVTTSQNSTNSEAGISYVNLGPEREM